MRDGFIKVAAGTPRIRVADCHYNAEQIFTMMREADQQGVRVLCLPELCLTGYTCGDLFLQDTLLRGAEEGLNTILEATRNLDLVTAVGLPVRDKWDGKLYNCAALIQQGEILGLVPKVHLPNYGEFYEKRWFASGKDMDNLITLCGQEVCLSDRLIWACEEIPDLVIGVEICEDLWAPEPPSAALARSGATLILNLSASNETVGKANYRRNLVAGQSGRLLCGYVYADAGEGESTTDLVFSGHNIIAENGSLLAERRFAAGLTISEIDVQRLAYERRRNTTFTPPARDPMAEAHCLGVSRVSFNLKVGETKLTRYVSPNPFVPADAEDRAAVQRDFENRRPGAEKAAGAHPGPHRCGGAVRGPGLHPGHPHYRRGHEAAGPAGERHHRGHHALLRHHRPHPGQRRGAGPAAGGHPEAHRHRRGGEGPLPGHRTVHGGPLRHL